MFKIYCTKCGEKLADNIQFCTKCGTPVTAETKPEATVFERLEKDTELQEHWIGRLVAYIIDSIVVGLATGILLLIPLFPVFIRNPFGFLNMLSFPFEMGLVSVIYFVIAESVYGTTIGKNLLGLKVTTTSNEKITIEKAFIRNISKIHGILTLLDVVAGLVTSTDLHQKYSDKIANTKVA